MDPNFKPLLWYIAISIGVISICKIHLGMNNVPKAQTYGTDDVLDGIVGIIVILMVLFT